MANMLSRRGFLTGGCSLLSVLLAGCLFNDGMGSAPDLFLSNRTDTDVALSIRVIRLSDDTEILLDTVAIAADEFLTYDDPITQAGKHEISVA